LGIQKERINYLLNPNQIAKIDLIIILLAIVLWLIFPNLQFAPAVIALLPWILRIKAKRQPIKSTPFSIPILLFLLTALIGAWIAYNLESALQEFWIILGSVLLFFTLSQQPSNNINYAISVMCLYGAMLAGYFFLTHNWIIQPADIEILNRIGAKWMLWRPVIHAPILHPNQIGGILAFIFPVCISLLFWAIGNNNIRQSLWLLIANGIIFSGIIFSSSRASWLAICIGLALWLIWKIVLAVSNKFNIKPNRVYLLIIVALVLSSVMFLVINSEKVVDGLGNLPGHESAGSRWDLYKNSVHLILDFPITGGGLGSFPGLYSQYILAVPFFISGYSNLYLDLAIEQGIFGSVSWIIILVICVIVFSRFFSSHKVYSSLSQTVFPALFSSFVILSLHGLVDNPLAENWAKPFLFIIPGFLTSLRHPEDVKKARYSIPVWIPITLTSTFLLGAFFLYKEQLQSLYYSNLGAIRMAQIELNDWPTGEWDDGSSVHAYTQPAHYFNQAIEIQEDNVTANHRLGLLSMLNHDFEQAAIYLESASISSPGHRGIIKTLGYSYIWIGQLEKAEDVLVNINEAQAEMRAYSWWWQEQGRDDLAERASLMVDRLESKHITQ
jgi:hypothetical protein